MKSVMLLPVLAGCSTIVNNQMEYLGDESLTSNVSGSVKHVDWYGIGVSGTEYIEEYDRPYIKHSKRRRKALKGSSI